MKLHKHLVDEIGKALVEIFQENKYADKIVESTLKHNRKWGARDRRFFAESVYDCVRWWRKLWYLLEREPQDLLSQEEVYEIFGTYRLIQGFDLPEWPEFARIIPLKDGLLKRNKDLVEGHQTELLAIRESIPDWMNQWGLRERGDRWPAILHGLNEKSQVDLRVNSRLCNRAELKKQLAEEEVLTNEVENHEFALTLAERKNVFVTNAYKAGLFEVQDRASQRISLFLDPQEGERVIDACAGAGGKSLHIATLMKNKGKVIALDIHDWKLAELQKRAKRNKIDIIETRKIDSTKVIKRLHDTANRVLLDVPCSGMGVLRRGPDTKWKLQESELPQIFKQQAEILESYAKMVGKDGYLVYATCSIMKSENQNQITQFLEKNSNDWALMKELSIDPDQGLGDGFYAVMLKRKS